MFVFAYVLLLLMPQVFDHPSVTAISNYIATLGLPSADTAGVSDDDDVPSEGASSTADYQLGTTAALQLVRAPGVAAPTSQAALIGIRSIACNTAAGNAVMQLPGVDASRRVPFSRWEVERQDQVCRALVWTALQVRLSGLGESGHFCLGLAELHGSSATSVHGAKHTDTSRKNLILIFIKLLLLGLKT